MFQTSQKMDKALDGHWARLQSHTLVFAPVHKIEPKNSRSRSRVDTGVSSDRLHLSEVGFPPNFSPPWHGR